jgi:hypothetical protein
MNQVKQVQDKGKKMAKLLDDELFNELIIEDFIKSGIYENAIYGNIDSPNTQDQLKARQILHKYIFDVITYAETVEK